MSKNQILAIVAATLLGAFWVYPSIERTQRPAPRVTRAPSSVETPTATVARPIQRKQTQIKPVRVAKTVAMKSLKRPSLAKRGRVTFERADRRPTSLPLKKPKKKKDNVASL